MTDAIMRAEPLKDGLGYIELIGTLGTDLNVVNAARVSYKKRSEEMSDKDRRLISGMMKRDHSSPFEAVVFQFRVRAPLHVVHQWERHRWASYNEESGRWTKMRGDFFVPESPHDRIYRLHFETSYQTYLWLIDHGESKENARLVLPLSLYKEFIWTINGLSLLNFFRLRGHEEAQEHIRVYSEAAEEMLTSFIPAVLDAFNEKGRPPLAG
jgi:thymidylate synthase (FAD)